MEKYFIGNKTDDWIVSLAVSSVLNFLISTISILFVLIEFKFTLCIYLFIFKLISLIVIYSINNKFIKRINKEEFESHKKDILNSILFSSTFLASIIIDIFFSKVFKAFEYIYNFIKSNFFEYLTNKFFPESKDKETYRD